MKIVQFPQGKRIRKKNISEKSERTSDSMGTPIGNHMLYDKTKSANTDYQHISEDIYLTTDQLRVAEAAEEGNMHCMRGMAELHESWWQRATRGDSDMRGPKGDPRYLFRRMIYWRVKAANAGDMESMRWLSVYIARYGAQYEISEDMTQGSSMDWQERAANAGDRFAMKWMGDRCTDQTDVCYDQNQAEEWYEKSAAAGCVYASHELAVRREKGIHGDKDPRKAIDWYLKSARFICRWRSISTTEREVCVEDLIRATEMLIQYHSLTEDECDQLKEYYDMVDLYMSWDRDEAELVKKAHKARMKLNVVR